MTDPFDVLRLPATPIAPDDAFAARLRAELAAALATDPTSTHERGDTMTATSRTVADRPTPNEARRPTLSPYLAVDDARRAAAWYVEVFGGELGEVVEMPDGRLGHAEVRIGDATLMLADEFPELGLVGPAARGGTTVSVVVDVSDVDVTTRRAAEAGATVEREPQDMPYGFRAAAVIDPFGHRWLIEAPLVLESEAVDRAAPAEPKPEEPANRPGDVAYITWRVRDEQKAAAFFGALLGWTFSPGHVEHGLQVHGANVLGGLWGGGGDADQLGAKLMYQVADIGEAVATIRALGGTATEPELQSYGWSSECTDDQGMEFWITALADG